MIYDIAIIGAGPSGIFCAHELCEHTESSIIMIDAGSPFSNKECPYLKTGLCVHCKSCSNLSGFGGAAFFNPGKLSMPPAGSGLLEVVGSNEVCESYYLKAINVLTRFGISVSDDFQPIEIPEVNKDEQVMVKNYIAHPIDRKTFNLFAKKMELFLSKHLTLKFNSEVASLNRDVSWRIVLKNGEEIRSKKIVIGVGEFGYRWWHETSKRLGVHQNISPIDIGIRLEFPSPLIECFWAYHKDLKLLLQAPDGSELRTYCVLKNGIMIPCYYGDYIVIDGISHDTSILAGMTLFNRIGEKELGQDKVDFANNYLKSFYGQYLTPQKCSASEFLSNRNLFAFSDRLYSNLCWGMKHIMDYLQISLNTALNVHVPVIDNLWRKCIVDNHFQTNIDGLYVIGDASGIARGIMQACVSGIIASEGLIRSIR